MQPEKAPKRRKVRKDGGARAPADVERRSTATRAQAQPRAPAVILSVLVLLGAGLRIEQVDQVADRTPDEQFYTYYAHRIMTSGPGEFRVLSAEHHQDPKRWVYPPPTRVGQIASIAALMKISGVENERAGSWLSAAESIASLALLAAMAARYLPGWSAVYATAGLAFSLPALIIAFRCWADAPMELLGVSMVWAACELRRGPRRWWQYAVLVAAGSVSVLVKETGAVIYLGCALYVMVLLIRERRWRPAGWLAAAGLAGAVLAVWCLSAAAGGITSLLAVWRDWSHGVLRNPYDMQYQSGPLLRFLRAYWVLTPANLIPAAVALTLAVLPQRRLQRLGIEVSPERLSELRLFSWMVLLIVLTVLAPPSSQNFRYLSPIYGCMYLLGGIGLWALVQWARRLAAWGGSAVILLAAVAVLSTGVQDYHILARAYTGAALRDLSVGIVIDARK